MFIFPVGLLIWGWTAHAETHWMGPVAGSAIFSYGLMLCFNSIQNWIVYAVYHSPGTLLICTITETSSFPTRRPRWLPLHSCAVCWAACCPFSQTHCFSTSATGWAVHCSR